MKVVKRFLIHRWAFLIALVILAVGFFFLYASKANEKEIKRAMASAVEEEVACVFNGLNDCLEFIADDLSDLCQTALPQNQREHLERTTHLIDAYPFVQAINYVGPDQRIRFASPARLIQAISGVKIESEEALQALETATSRQRPYLSKAFEIFQGGLVYSLVVPCSERDLFQIVFTVDKVFGESSAFRCKDEIAIQISDEMDLVFSSFEYEQRLISSTAYRMDAKGAILNRDMHLSAVPMDELLDKSSQFWRIISIGGFGSSLVLLSLIAVLQNINIAGRRSVEKELQKHRDHLEERVEQRTVELTRSNERLEQEIIERARTEKELRRQTAQMEALQQVGLEITGQLDLEALLHSIATRAVDLLDGDHGGLFLYQPDRELLEWVVDVGVRDLPIGSTLQRGEGLSGKVWESGEPLIVDDYSSWEGRTITYEDLSPVSVVGVPVHWSGELLGVINIGADAPGVFSQTDVDLLSLFATQAAIAIRNARLFEDERRLAARLAVVNQVARKTVLALESDQLLQEIVTAIQQGFEYHNVILLLLDETTGKLGEQVAGGGFEHLASLDYCQSMDEGLIGWAARIGQSLMVNDVTRDPRYIVGFSEQVPTRSELCVPLKLADQVIGVLDIQETRVGAFDEGDLVAMETLADQIAGAIESVRLYKKAQQELAGREQVEEALRWLNRELALLNQAIQAFSSTLDLDQVLAAVLEEVRRLLDVVASSVWLRDLETGELVCRHVIGPQSEMVRGWRLASGVGLVGWVAQKGKSLIVPDIRKDERHFGGVDRQTMLPLRSILSIPLRAKSSVIGVLQVVDAVVDRFDAADLDLLEPLAAAAATAIENARLYEQAQQDAATRSVLLREVNHRVKNNLTGIIGLLYAAQSHAKVSDQASYQAAMNDLIGRVRGLATAHGMLSAGKWAPLRLSDLADQIIRAVLQTFPHEKQISIEVPNSPVRVTADEAHDLALVINELATNAVKYALGERDTACIIFRTVLENGDDVSVVRCEFRDDGPGYPKDVLQLERLNVGFDLIQNIVCNSLRGELSLKNECGAVAIIRFKTGVASGDGCE